MFHGYDILKHLETWYLVNLKVGTMVMCTEF